LNLRTIEERRLRADEIAAAAPSMEVRFPKGGYDAGIEDATNKLHEAGVLLCRYRLVAVLKQAARTVVAVVEVYGIAGKEAAHEPGQSLRRAAKKEMKPVRSEGKGINLRMAPCNRGTRTFKEPFPVGVIPENGAALNPPCHHMMEGALSIEAGLSGHGSSL
jgi:hypothetical protein